MLRFLRSALMLLAVLATAAAFPLAAAPASSTPVEGVDFRVIEGGVPFQPVAGKVEVAEVFGYTCGHCARFEPQLAAWKRTLPARAHVVAIPAPFGGYWIPYARAYVAAQALGVADRSHAAMFRALHDERRLPMNNPGAEEIAAFYTAYGVPVARFVAAYNAPSVDARLARARDFITRSGIDGTPSMVVAGRYHVLGRNAADTLRIARWLVDRELATRKR